METAIVNIAPLQDERVVAFQNEVAAMLTWAQNRTIASDDDVQFATSDLGLMASMKKAVEEKRKEYVEPLNTHVKAINEVFKTITEPLSQADKLTREKVLAYRMEVDRKRREIEELNRQAEELARKQAALNNGEITVDLTPVVAPAAPPAHVRTETGTLGTSTVWKFEVTDFKALPDEYKMVDSAKLGKVVRAGLHNIPGVRIWDEPVIKITTK